jgi:hypothetical protein
MQRQHTYLLWRLMCSNPSLMQQNTPQLEIGLT